MKVDFMIIGAQKCGTTTLSHILAAHPSIVGSRPLEPHFFSTATDWKRELPAYETLFDQKQGALYFEASTSYTFYPLRNLAIWNDIYAYNPDTRFIYLVRNPIDRVVSSYMHTYERGYTDAPIEEALVGNRLFIDVTRYYTQILPFIETFGRNQVHIIDFDDLIQRRTKVLQGLAEFIGVEFEGFQRFVNVRANVSVGGGKRHHRFDTVPFVLKVVRKWMPSVWDRITDNSARAFHERPTLPRAYREMILRMLHLEIEGLERLMDKDLSHWKALNVER